MSETNIPTVSITPETIISTEGDSLVWNYILDRPVPEGGLTLNLVITQDTESSPDDGIFNLEASSGITDSSLLLGNNEFFVGFSSTLAEGVTQAQYVVNTFVDDILETDEISSVTLADGENYLANPNQNTIDFILTDRTVVTLTSEQVNIAEGDTFTWNFNLNRPAPVGGLTLSLPITQNNDPAPGDVEYNVEGSTNITDFGFITEDDVSLGFILTIPEGETEARLVSQAIVDDVAEFDEIFTTILADGLNYVANPIANQVVTTIVEDGEAPPSSAPVVSIAPSTLISTEGETFAWDFTLDKPVPEGGLTLSLPITQNNDPAPGDVEYNVEGSIGISDFDFIVEDDISIGFSVTLEEGVESATLVSQAVADDDDIEESADEISTAVLADGVDYRANPDSNEVQTILTGQPVVTLTPEQVNVTEGNTFAWNFSLNKPAPVGGLNLTLPITFNNDPAPGDVNYNVDGSSGIADFDFLVIDDVSLGFNITIAEGETEATLVSQAVADGIEEGDEIFTTVLNDGEDYRANPVGNQVVTTIVDTSTETSTDLPTVSFSADRSVITEGGEAQLLTFNLSEPAPQGGLVVDLQIDDPDGESGPGDTEFPPELISNIVDFGQVEEDGTITASLTIAEGATEATFGIAAFEDEQIETGETYSLTLLETENYIADPASTTITTTIEDSVASSLPVVDFIADTTVVSEGGEAQLITFNLSEPAPAGGLAIKLRIDDPDGEPGDTDNALELFSNVTDFNDRVEDGVFVANITIAEGATQATIGIKALADNQVEGAETYSLTLLENENYIVDPASTTITTTIEDNMTLPTVSITPETVLTTEGDSFAWNISLDEPVPEGGLTLNLVITQNTEPTPGDAIPNFEASSGITERNLLLGENETLLGFTYTLAEGITEATLVADTVVDNIQETDEIGSLAIADGEDYRANPARNTLTNIFTDRTIVTLTTDEVNVTEGDTFAWNFSLNRPAPEGGLTLSLPITLNNDPAPGDVEYNVEGSTNITDFGFITKDDVSLGFTLTIPEGETEATLVSEAVVDDVAEFDEIFTTVLADGLNYVANPLSNQVVTTIVEPDSSILEPDSSSVPVVSITPSAVISTEGDTFAWEFTLDRPVPEGGLTLNLPITQNNDPAPGDVNYNVEGSTSITDFDFIVEDDISIGFSVTLEEGVESATLVSEAVADDDDLEEAADEIFTTVLADGVDYRANPDSNEVRTILTRETVVSFTPEQQVSLSEGDSFAWNFSLNRPAPVGGLTLTLPITFNNDPEPGDVDYNVEGSTNISDFSFLVVDDVSLGFNVTIAEGETEATLISQAVADGIEEGDEIFTTILNDGADYRADPLSREVITTIENTSLPTLSLSAEPTEVEEGSQLLWNFELTEPVPEGGLTVALDLVEDTDPLPGDITYFVEGSENISDFELIINEESGLIEQALVTLDEGATSATLVNDIIADNATEGEESVSFALAELEDYAIDSEVNAASFTILDTSINLPTISVFAEPTEVEEGSQLLWNFSLTEPVGEGGLTVALNLVEDTDPLPGDITYFVEGSENISDFELIINEESGLIEQALVTLDEGITSATLVNDIIADNATEGEESVSFALAESENYATDSEVNAASFTILDTSTDLITTTSTSISFELDDLLVPARESVVDVSFDLDYVSGIEDSEFLEVGAIADSIENYLANNPGEGDFFEVITEDLTEFLVSDAGLGISSVAESIAVELDVEPNSVIPFPFSVSSTIEVDGEDSFLGIKGRSRPLQQISLLEDGIESTFDFQDVGEVPGLFNEVGDSGSYEAVLLEESEPVGTAFIEFELVAQQPNGEFIAEVENFLDFGEGNTITLEGELNVQRFEALQPAQLAITEGEGIFDDAKGIATLNQVELDILDVINIDLLVI